MILSQFKNVILRWYCLGILEIGFLHTTVAIQP